MVGAGQEGTLNPGNACTVPEILVCAGIASRHPGRDLDFGRGLWLVRHRVRCPLVVQDRVNGGAAPDFPGPQVPPDPSLLQHPGS